MSLKKMSEEVSKEFKSKLLEALKSSVNGNNTGPTSDETMVNAWSQALANSLEEASLAYPADTTDVEGPQADLEPRDGIDKVLPLGEGGDRLEDGASVYSLLLETGDEDVEALDPALQESAARLKDQLQEVITHLEDSSLPAPSPQVPAQTPASSVSTPQENRVKLAAPDTKSSFNDTLSLGNQEAPLAEQVYVHPPAHRISKQAALSQGLTSAKAPGSNTMSLKEKRVSGGNMADLSGYKDLSKAPLSFGDDLPEAASSYAPEAEGLMDRQSSFASVPGPNMADLAQDIDTEFSGNVKTLIRLVNELPEGVTKQTGAQIIRLTMEAMGISMEDVLSEAQSAQSEMLDAVRANIKKIEEYKTVIRKLETDIKYYQGKANELSEIIDLFILSNTSGGNMPNVDEYTH